MAVNGWGLEYLHRYHLKQVIKSTNGFDYEVVMVFYTFLLNIFTVPDDDDDVCNLCLASI